MWPVWAVAVYSLEFPGGSSDPVTSYSEYLQHYVGSSIALKVEFVRRYKLSFLN